MIDKRDFLCATHYSWSTHFDENCRSSSGPNVDTEWRTLTYFLSIFKYFLLFVFV
jgi:hypothetical protein